jgi:DNA polymerase theta
LLIEHQFVRENDNKLVPTNLGQACLAASVTPEIGLKLIKKLDKARQNFALDSELNLLYLVRQIISEYFYLLISKNYYVLYFRLLHIQLVNRLAI